jgi:hypothetical protein
VLEVERLGAGAWRWSAAPGTWSHLLELPHLLLLVDPHFPDPGSPDAERFWRHLDHDVARQGRPVAVLVTTRIRLDAARAILDRYPGSRLISGVDDRESIF